MTSSSRRVTAVLAILACALAASLASAAAATAAGAPAGIRPAPAAPGAAAPASAVSAQSPSLVYAYPPSYDLRDKGKVSPVKDQSPYGTCWAFAAIGSLESNLLPGETWDFSEDNLLWYSGFDNAGYDGGNSLMATAYLARWSGPFTEQQDGYDKADDGAHPAPSTLAVQKHVQEVDFLPARTSPADNDDIKYALTNWGASTSRSISRKPRPTGLPAPTLTTTTGRGLPTTASSWLAGTTSTLRRTSSTPRSATGPSRPATAPSW